jgi:tetrahydromethanopterin S-methyltransferase subunit C
MFNFDLVQIIVSSVISAVILFIIGVFTRRTLDFDAGDVIFILEISSVIFVPFFVFYLSHPAGSIEAFVALFSFLPEYVTSVITALFGLIIGDAVGSILKNANRSAL